VGVSEFDTDISDSKRAVNVIKKACTKTAVRNRRDLGIPEKMTAEEIIKALEVLVMYEQWEADVIMCDQAWNTQDGLPHMTQELWDSFLNVQEARNKALKREVNSL
jgi:hypothetical protein